MQRWRMSKSMEESLMQCHSYSRSGATAQSLPGSKLLSLRLSLRLCAFAGVIFLPLLASAQTKPLSEQAAATAMTALWRDPAKNESGFPAKWTYDHGLVLKGI